MSHILIAFLVLAFVLGAVFVLWLERKEWARRAQMTPDELDQDSLDRAW